MNDKNIMDDLSKSIGDYYNKQNAIMMYAPLPFTSDVEVEESVPKYYIDIPIPYIQKSYSDEGERNPDQWVFGFIWRTLFTFGKKKRKRFLYTWELTESKRKPSIIKFTSYDKT